MQQTAPATEMEPVRHQCVNVRRRGCLALNASYEPLTMIPVARAVRLIHDGRAEAVEVDGTRIIRSAEQQLPYPLVIRLVRYIHIPRRLRKGVSNLLLFARDNYSCQYCGRHRRELRQREFLTRDHVIPQSRFEPKSAANSWGNVASACSPCNANKADKTPAEAGMRLLSTPTEPHFVKLVWAVRRLTPLQKKYIAMFYGDDVLTVLNQ